MSLAVRHGFSWRHTLLERQLQYFIDLVLVLPWQRHERRNGNTVVRVTRYRPVWLLK